MSKKGGTHKKYSPEFKISVILDILENGLSFRKVTRKYFGATNRRDEENHKAQPKAWLKIYLEEGEAGFYKEPKRGRMKKKPKDIIDIKPSTIPIEGDLEAENKRLNELVEYLQMENDYLKKLRALVQKESQQKNKRR